MTAPVAVSDKNIILGEVIGIVIFDEPFDDFVRKIKVRNSRFWIDKNTIFEGVTLIDDLRERDKVSISYYEWGIDKIATHIRVVR